MSDMNTGAAAPQDERDQFEALYTAAALSAGVDFQTPVKAHRQGEGYGTATHLDGCWVGWKMRRAALPAQAVATVGNEPVAWLDPGDLAEQRKDIMGTADRWSHKGSRYTMPVYTRPAHAWSDHVPDTTEMIAPVQDVAPSDARATCCECGGTGKVGLPDLGGEERAACPYCAVKVAAPAAPQVVPTGEEIVAAFTAAGLNTDMHQMPNMLYSVRGQLAQLAQLINGARTLLATYAQPAAQPADAQPFAYLARAESGNTIIWSVDQATVRTAADKYGRPLEALYLAPATIKESLTVEARTQEGAAS